MKSATNSQRNEVFALAYLVVGLFSSILCFYQYWTGDMMRAIFWLILAVACDVSIIRRAVS